MYNRNDVKTGQIIFRKNLQYTCVDDDICRDLLCEQESTNSLKNKERLNEMLILRFQVITKAWEERYAN